MNDLTTLLLDLARLARAEKVNDLGLVRIFPFLRERGIHPATTERAKDYSATGDGLVRER